MMDYFGAIEAVKMLALVVTKRVRSCVSSLASLGWIDGNSLAVGTLLGSLSVVSLNEAKDWTGECSRSVDT